MSTTTQESRAVQVGRFDKGELTAFEPTNLHQLQQVCQCLAQSKLIPDSLRGKPEDVQIVAMKGRELGFPFMYSLAHIHVIKGNATVSAEAMAAMVMASPVCEQFSPIEYTNEKVTYRAKRAGADPIDISFTMDDAKTAGLANQPNYKSHPTPMLAARACSRAARAVFPDVIGGVYVHGEVPLETVQPSTEERLDELAKANGNTQGVIPRPEPKPAEADVIEEVEDATVEEEPDVISKDDAKRLANLAMKRAKGDKDIAKDIVTDAVGLVGVEKLNQVPVTHLEVVEMAITNWTPEVQPDDQ